MTKDDVQSLMIGAVLAVLGYAAYKHFKAAPTAVAPPAGQGAPVAPPSPYTSLTDLLTGVVHDIGSYEGRNYLNEMADPLINGNGGKDSIVKPGGYW